MRGMLKNISKRSKMTRAKRFTCGGIDPQDERIEGDFENGSPPGMNDKPRDIYARLKERYARILPVVDRRGPVQRAI